MADSKLAVTHQASFLGGEWSPMAQGRSDQDAYKTAMYLCFNGLPVIEGAWVRRSGTEWVAPTVGRTYSKLHPFIADSGLPIVFEFGDTVLRFYSGSSRVTVGAGQVITASSSSAGIVSATTTSAHGWSTGDTLMLTLSAGAATDASLYLNRPFTVASTPTTTTLTAKDDVGNAFGFNPSSGVLIGCTFTKVKQFSTSWGASVTPGINLVQASDSAIFLCKTVPPKTLPISVTSGVITFGSLNSLALRDGPYLDRQETAPGTAEGGAVSGYSGSITFTPASSTFTAADVGRLIRLYHEPAAWASGTTYTYGQTVSYEGKWWVSIAAGTYASNNVGVIPGTLLTTGTAAVVVWAPAVQAGRWAWGTISAQATTSCTVVLSSILNSANGATISQWRLGVYTTSQYPTCGTFHNGRLYLAGAVNNRMDASVSNDKTNFAPTDAYGNVTDADAVGMVLNFDEQQVIRWMASDRYGLLVGTSGGEILISSTADNITPFDKEASKTTRFQCADVQPCRVGTALVFVQKYQRQLIEYKPMSFGSTRYTGEVLNEKSQHLPIAGIDEIAYQQIPTPVLWQRTRYGRLMGMTYRRTDTELIAGAHQHELAAGDRLVASLCVAPDPAGFGDLLYLCTYGKANTWTSASTYADGNDFAIEIMRPLLSEN